MWVFLHLYLHSEYIYLCHMWVLSHIYLSLWRDYVTFVTQVCLITPVYLSDYIYLDCTLWHMAPGLHTPHQLMPFHRQTEFQHTWEAYTKLEHTYIQRWVINSWSPMLICCTVDFHLQTSTYCQKIIFSSLSYKKVLLCLHLEIYFVPTC